MNNNDANTTIDGKKIEVTIGSLLYSDKVLINLEDGYEIKDENGQLYAVKKKEYPKTYEECCKVLGVNPDNYLTIRNVHCYDGEEETVKYERYLLDKFRSLWKLLICRDAYWKIAGEKMGLGKSWEPDLTDNVIKHCIEFRDCGVCKVTYSYTSKILSFPTEEIRETFYENFKEEIEKYKELL